MEHEERAESLETEADELAHYGDEVEKDIESARRDWEEKKQDSSVPGAVADPEDQMENQEREESDQLPEEAPEDQVSDDAGGEARDEAEENAGHPGEDDTGTGNPDAAGTDDEEDQTGA